MIRDFHSPFIFRKIYRVYNGNKTGLIGRTLDRNLEVKVRVLSLIRDCEVWDGSSGKLIISFVFRRYFKLFNGRHKKKGEEYGYCEF